MNKFLVCMTVLFLAATFAEVDAQTVFDDEPLVINSEGEIEKYSSLTEQSPAYYIEFLVKEPDESISTIKLKVWRDGKGDYVVDSSGRRLYVSRQPMVRNNPVNVYSGLNPTVYDPSIPQQSSSSGQLEQVMQTESGRQSSYDRVKARHHSRNGN